MKAFNQDLDEITEFLDFLEEDLENIHRVITYVQDKNIDAEFEIHAKAETVEDSAKHSDIDKSRIVKSLVFIADEPILVLCSGDKRVDTDKLENIRESSVRMANPDEVEKHTGYIIGGVSPFDTDLPVYMEESINQHETVRPAAGSRLVGIRIKPETLKKAVNAEIRELAE